MLLRTNANLVKLVSSVMWSLIHFVMGGFVVKSPLSVTILQHVCFKLHFNYSGCYNNLCSL